jgi:hypothetical protein
VSPDDPGELAELLRRVGEGESVRLETQHLRSDGERIDVALTAVRCATAPTPSWASR